MCRYFLHEMTKRTWFRLLFHIFFCRECLFNDTCNISMLNIITMVFVLSERVLQNIIALLITEITKNVDSLIVNSSLELDDFLFKKNIFRRLIIIIWIFANIQDSKNYNSFLTVFTLSRLNSKLDQTLLKQNRQNFAFLSWGIEQQWLKVINSQTLFDSCSRSKLVSLEWRLLAIVMKKNCKRIYFR